VQEEDFDILEKLKDKYDPNEIVKIKEEVSKEAGDATQPSDSAMNTPNPPPVATLPVDSDTEMKEAKPEVDEAMPLSDVKSPVMDNAIPEKGEEKPSQEADSSDTKPAIPVGLDTPVTSGEATEDVNMD
jgi:hypothetical protein